MSRAMKDSGIPWIGEIPEGWKVCFIKQIMRNKSIKGFPNERVLSLYRDYGVIPKDSRDDNHNVTSDDTSSYKLVDEGDFVINKMKAWQGSMAVSEYRGIISPAYYICRFTSTDINKRYIHYLLRNDSYKTEYMRLSSGLRVGQWDLNIDDFLRIMMILPPLAEQQRIAEFLDRKCAEVDEMIALQEQIIEELKAYKQSVITEAVTKGLNPDVPMKDSGIEWIGEIPEHWEVCRVKDILEAGKDGIKIGPFGSSLTNKVNGDGECKIYGQWNIVNKDFTAGKNFVSAETYKELDAYKIVAGDILVSMMGTIGKCAIIPNGLQDGIMDSHVIKIRINKSTINPEYFELMYDKDNSTFIFEQLSRMKKGSIMDGLNSSIVKRLNLLLPPIDEQQEIVSYLLEKRSKIESLISIKLSKIDSLKEYKKSIIYEYVTGKREVE